MSDSGKVKKFVVVVHGIGAQRKFETTLSLINGIHGAHRDGNNDKEWKIRGPEMTSKSLAQLRSHADANNGLVALQDFSPEAAAKFPNKEIIFVDCCWSPILEEHASGTQIWKGAANVNGVSASTSDWTKKLIYRFLNRYPKLLEGAPADDGETGLSADAQKSTIGLLFAVRSIALRIEFLTGLRFQSLRALIFDRYISDVHIYADSGTARVKAVSALFHCMEKIVDAGLREDDEICVVAHSLGTVMTRDALTAAAVLATSDGPNKEACLRALDNPDVLPKISELNSPIWFSHVKSWVTLGSPIDKFYTLWPESFRFANVNAENIDKSSDKSKVIAKIDHYNFAEEQDPVASRLGVVRKSPVYNAIFESRASNEYCHESIFGVAHVAYFYDHTIMKSVLAIASGGDGSAFESELYEKDNQHRVMCWHLVMPWCLTVVCLITAAILGANSGNGGSIPIAIGLFLFARLVLHDVAEMMMTFRYASIADPRRDSGVSSSRKWNQRAFTVMQWVFGFGFASLASVLVAAFMVARTGDKAQVIWPRQFTWAEVETTIPSLSYWSVPVGVFVCFGVVTVCIEYIRKRLGMEQQFDLKKRSGAIRNARTVRWPAGFLVICAYFCAVCEFQDWPCLTDDAGSLARFVGAHESGVLAFALSIFAVGYASVQTLIAREHASAIVGRPDWGAASKEKTAPNTQGSHSPRPSAD